MKVLDLRKINNGINIGALAIPSHPDVERKLIFWLVILVLVLGISYGYFVKQTILNVITRQETEELITDTSSHVSSLEVRYIELKNKINLNFAYSSGYKDVSEVKFISRSQMEKTLTLNRE